MDLKKKIHKYSHEHAYTYMYTMAVSDIGMLAVDPLVPVVCWVGTPWSDSCAFHCCSPDWDLGSLEVGLTV